LGNDVDIEVLRSDLGPAAPDMGLFDSLSAVLKSLDPFAIPIPFVMAGVSDARFFSQLGIQTYGFVPLQLPDDFKFISSIHAADERVPVAALDFGVQAIFRALRQFH
jgi:acetylornithine deacetylase/succinyl-diaminopimelate desuccinylase-like protein